MSLKEKRIYIKKQNPIQRKSLLCLPPFCIFLVPEVSGRDLGDMRSWTAYRTSRKICCILILLKQVVYLISHSRDPRWMWSACGNKVCIWVLCGVGDCMVIGFENCRFNHWTVLLYIIVEFVTLGLCFFLDAFSQWSETSHKVSVSYSSLELIIIWNSMISSYSRGATLFM